MFEGLSNVRKNKANEFFHESDVEFPRMVRTPSALQDLVKRRTADASAWSVRASDRAERVVRADHMLHSENWIKRERPVETPQDVLPTAEKWWKQELDSAAQFFGGTGQMDQEYGRAGPRLREVLDALESFSNTL